MGKKPYETWLSKEKCIKLQNRFGNYETYEETGGGRGENKKSIIRVLKNLSSIFNNKPNILEVGSGPGHFIWVMKDYSNNITGLDYSPHMIELSKDALKNFSNVCFIEGSCLDIPFKNDEFDLVYQVDVCMHIGNSFDSILEMIRVSKKYVVFTGPSFDENEINFMDKQLSRLSWAISVPLLEQSLDILIKSNKIKSYHYENRPKTKMYNHRILIIEK